MNIYHFRVGLCKLFKILLSKLRTVVEDSCQLRLGCVQIWHLWKRKWFRGRKKLAILHLCFRLRLNLFFRTVSFLHNLTYLLVQHAICSLYLSISLLDDPMLSASVAHTAWWIFYVRRNFLYFRYLRHINFIARI